MLMIGEDVMHDLSIILNGDIINHIDLRTDSVQQFRAFANQLTDIRTIEYLLILLNCLLRLLAQVLHVLLLLLQLGEHLGVDLII